MIKMMITKKFKLKSKMKFQQISQTLAKRMKPKLRSPKTKQLPLNPKLNPNQLLSKPPPTYTIKNKAKKTRNGLPNTKNKSTESFDQLAVSKKWTET